MLIFGVKLLGFLMVFSLALSWVFENVSFFFLKKKLGFDYEFSFHEHLINKALAQLAPRSRVQDPQVCVTYQS